MEPPEAPRTLITKATRVLEDCENLLEVASESVHEIPARREEALKDIAAAREEYERASKEFSRVLDGDLSRWHQDVAEEEMDKARRRVSIANSYLASDYFDTEYRKAVARQIAGIVHEDSLQRLDYIVTRSADPELQRTVAECREGVNRVSRYAINSFPKASDIPPAEVRKAHVEARETLDYIRNPPVD